MGNHNYNGWCNRFLAWLFYVLLAIPFYPVFALFLLAVALPLRVYSKAVATLATLLDPDISKVLTGLTAGQGRDFDMIYKKPATVEVVCIRMRGTLDFPLLMTEFERRIVLKLDRSKTFPTLHYPELQQYFTVFLGYLCLKKDPKFDTRNHVKFYNEGFREKPVTREGLRRIWEGMMTKPFGKNRSPWELLVIDNYIPDENELETWSKNNRIRIGGDGGSGDHYWIAMFRMHHALGDGFSIQQLLGFMTDQQYTPVMPVRMTPFQKLVLNARALFLGPYDMMVKMLETWEGFHALHRPYKEHSGDYYVIESKLFTTERVKQLKRKFGVPFTVILVSLISGGFRKFLIKHGKPLPEKMGAAVPIATVDHSDKFTNEL